MDTRQIVLAILGSTTVTAVITALLNRKKSGADATKTNVESSLLIVSEWQKLNAENKLEIASNKERLSSIESDLRKTILEHNECEERLSKLERRIKK